MNTRWGSLVEQRDQRLFGLDANVMNDSVDSVGHFEGEGEGMFLGAHKSILVSKRIGIPHEGRLSPFKMDIRTFFSLLHMSKSRGAAAAKSGFEYERELYRTLQTLTWNGEPVRLSDPAGANKHAHDIILLNNGLTFEAKTKGATEGGGCTMSLKDGAFQLPEQSVLRGFFPSDFQLWDGKIPSFLTGDKSEATWLAEKDFFKGIYLPASPSAVAEYYRAKGTMYMQIEGKGIYHTGDDRMGWGVPKFEPECRVRIRLKQHHSGSVPQDCQACFNYNGKTLPPTPYDFLDPLRLPPGFTRPGE